jgi:hypothetical protein
VHVGQELLDVVSFAATLGERRAGKKSVAACTVLTRQVPTDKRTNRCRRVRFPHHGLRFGRGRTRVRACSCAASARDQRGWRRRRTGPMGGARAKPGRHPSRQRLRKRWLATVRPRPLGTENNPWGLRTQSVTWLMEWQQAGVSDPLSFPYACRLSYRPAGAIQAAQQLVAGPIIPFGSSTPTAPVRTGSVLCSAGHLGRCAPSEGLPGATCTIVPTSYCLVLVAGCSEQLAPLTNWQGRELMSRG